MTEHPSDRCYPQIFLIPYSKGGNPGIAYASEVAFFQKAFRRTFHFFRIFLSSPLCEMLN